MLLKRLLVGLPLKTKQAVHERLSKRLALAVFSSNAISSVAYATEEILLVLVLAGLGLYGVMAFVVSQRAQEFGIRLALGAKPRDILGLAFRPGLMLTATGTIVGLGASIVVTRLMASLLFGVSASDPMTFAVVPVLLGIVTMAACFIPARRATLVSPMEALK